MTTRTYLDKHLITAWDYKLKHLWSIRVALFWIVVSAVAGIWSALVDTIPTWAYVSGGILMNLSLGLARLTKQPGVDE